MTARKKKAGPPADAPRLVADLVLAGVGRDQVRAFLEAELAYRPPARELEKLLTAAKAAIKDQAAEYAETADDVAIVRLNDLYTRALKAADVKTALDVQKAISRYIAARPQEAGAAADQAPAPAGQAPPPPVVQAAGPRPPGGYADVMVRAKGRPA